MVYTIVVHLYAKDSPDSISRLHDKLLEASDVYSKDRETISWFVMQDWQDKRAFTIVERFEHESVCRITFLFHGCIRAARGIISGCEFELMTYPL